LAKTGGVGMPWVDCSSGIAVMPNSPYFCAISTAGAG